MSEKYRISENDGDYWNVMFGEQFVMRCRAKSRSKAEMQKLLDHFNSRETKKYLINDAVEGHHDAEVERTTDVDFGDCTGHGIPIGGGYEFWTYLYDAEPERISFHIEKKVAESEKDLRRKNFNAKHEQSNEEVSSVSVLWGQLSDYLDDVPLTYCFDTKAEMEAFLHGVDESSGWMDYAAIRHSYGPDQKFNPEDFDLDPSEMRKGLAAKWKKYIARGTEEKA